MLFLLNLPARHILTFPQAKDGKNMNSDGFTVRAQSAGDKNQNTLDLTGNGGKGGAGGNGGGASGSSSVGNK